MKRIVIFLTVFLVLIPISTSIASTPYFQGLGDLPEDFSSKAYGISGDGQVVVGVSQNEAIYRNEAFYWTRETGMVGMGDFPGRNFHSRAHASSYDGSIIVGYGKPDWSGYQAFRWTTETGLDGLGHLPHDSSQFSFSNDVSTDGSVVVGNSRGTLGTEAFMWTKSTGMIGLGHLSGGDESYYYSTAESVSGDGSVVVGVDNSTGHYKAYKWTKATGMTGLAPEHSFSKAIDVSDDGDVIVGNYRRAFQTFAFRWTEEDGLVSLGEIPGHATQNSTAYAISADGSIIVGGNNDWVGPYSGDQAFIWDEINGMRNLQDMLENDYNFDLDGWTLIDARGISDDGLTFTGTGINPDGNTEAWIATVPEPATSLLLCLGGLALRRKRKVN